jgi:hypothetical protein
MIAFLLPRFTASMTAWLAVVWFCGVMTALSAEPKLQVRGFPIYTIYHFEDLAADSSGGSLYEDEYGHIFVVTEGHVERFDGRDWMDVSAYNEVVADEIVSMAGKGERPILWCGGWLGTGRSQRNGDMPLSTADVGGRTRQGGCGEFPEYQTA